MTETRYRWVEKSLEFCVLYGIDVEMVEAVIDRPTSTGLHPASGRHGYPIKAYRRGDMEVCVSFKPDEKPAIAFVHLHLPIDNSKGGAQHNAVRKAAAKAPNGLNQFKQWVYDAGYTVELRNGHLAILRPNGSRLMGTGSTPGDKMAVTAAWQKFLRLSAADRVMADVRKSLEADNDGQPQKTSA